MISCQIKICGITNAEDQEWIARCGADYGGVLVEIDSPRGLILERAWNLFTDPPLPMVAVTLDRNAEQLIEWMAGLRPAALQLHGYESPEQVACLKKKVDCEIWKVIHLPAAEEGASIDVDAINLQMQDYANAGADRFLVDAAITRQGIKQLGGTGKTVDWQIARTIRQHSPKPFIVAGGIHPGNVAEAITIVRPDGIDLSSGVEFSKGKKDPDKVMDVIARARACEEGDEIC